ncbi:MAG: hypothetical protein KAQ94_06250 [Arcobacteraceae bacterium]|nr:hypothetical protein [Arcobacteraceae bacterium]
MMRRKDIFSDQFAIFSFFIIVSLVNIISSVHFIPIMFAGIVFIVFNELLQKRYYYSLFWILLTFLVIENIQGFGTFSLFFTALFIYLFIKSSVAHIFSSSDLTKSLYIIIFYVSMIFVYSIFNGFNILSLSIIAINIILDIIIVGLFI